MLGGVGGQWSCSRGGPGPEYVYSDSDGKRREVIKCAILRTVLQGRRGLFVSPSPANGRRIVGPWIFEASVLECGDWWMFALLLLE